MVVETCDIALQEAARVINVMRERGVSQADLAAVLDWSDATAARGPRQPQPAMGLELLRDLRLISVDASERILLHPTLSTQGAKPASYIDHLPKDILGVVFQRLMSSAPLRQELRHVLNFCTIDVEQVLVTWSAVPPAVRKSPAWLWLQRVGSASPSANGLLLDPSLLPFVAEIHEPAVPLSQSALDARLALQRRRATLAEEHVVWAEKERLKRLGAGHFAEAVERVSVGDVCAGYDILSFEVSGDPRLIEVKSSAGPRSRFFLSDNERRIAKANGDAYWLAWVGWAAHLPDGTPEVCWVKNLDSVLASAPKPWSISPCDTVVDLLDDDSMLQTAP